TFEEYVVQQSVDVPEFEEYVVGAAAHYVSAPMDHFTRPMSAPIVTPAQECQVDILQPMAAAKTAEVCEPAPAPRRDTPPNNFSAAPKSEAPTTHSSGLQWDTA